MKNKTLINSELLEPLAGIEPATYSLRVNCSTPELQRLLHSKSG